MKPLFTSSNLTILVKAFALSLFFTGTGHIFDLLLPKRSWTNALVMVGLAIAVLMMDDGSLSELYDLKPSTAAAAAAAAARLKGEDGKRM